MKKRITLVARLCLSPSSRLAAVHARRATVSTSPAYMLDSMKQKNKSTSQNFKIPKSMKIGKQACMVPEHLARMLLVKAIQKGSLRSHLNHLGRLLPPLSKMRHQGNRK